MTLGDGETTALIPIGAWPLKAGDTLYCRWVRSDTIPDEHRRFVNRHVGRLAGEHRLGTIYVRYFEIVPPSEGPWIGEFTATVDEEGTLPAGVFVHDRPNTIGLLASLRGPGVPAAIAHEISHVIQDRDNGYQSEEESRKLERSYLANYLGLV